VRPSRRLLDQHERAVDLVHGTDRPLSEDEVRFCYANWLPMAGNRVDVSGAFFTPIGLARDIAVLKGTTGRLVDICAGIGVLAFQQIVQGDPWARWPHLGDHKEIVAIEQSSEYVAVGKRLLPQVHWIQADALDRRVWLPPENLFEESGPALCASGRLDMAICNPPFGRVRTVDPESGAWIGYKGPADLMFARLCTLVAEDSVVILPVGSIPPKHQRSHGRRGEDGPMSSALLRFVQGLPKIVRCENLGIECGYIADEDYEWRGTNPVVDVVEFERDYYDRDRTDDYAYPLPSPSAIRPEGWGGQRQPLAEAAGLASAI